MTTSDSTQRDELAQIKARFEKAGTARRDSNDTMADIQALLLSEQSSHDVPKLVAALEAVEAMLTTWRQEAVGTSAEDSTTRALTYLLRNTIKGALT